LAGWLPPPALNISGQPTNQTVNALLPAAFSVTAGGIFAPAYQWRHAGTNLPGATSAALNLAHVHAEDAGAYNCVVSNVNAVLVSSNATLTVNAATRPDVTSITLPGGQALLSVSGDFGPDYAVQASTNLVDWQTVFTTNSPAVPFNWSDTDTGSYPVRFYRIVAGPPLP
jgi:hypothetical protein